MILTEVGIILIGRKDDSNVESTVLGIAVTIEVFQGFFSRGQISDFSAIEVE